MLILNWIGKVVEMKEHRFLKAALEIYLDLMQENPVGEKYKWLGIVKEIFLASIEQEGILEDSECLREMDMRLEKYIQDKYIQFRRSFDSSKSTSSSSLFLYSSLPVDESGYILVKKSLHEKALISQLILLNKYNCKVILKGSTYIRAQF